MGLAVTEQAGALVGGKYRLLRKVGSGGMGTVWIARNETTRAEVAIKLWHAHATAEGSSAERASTAERFRREAQLAALVTHRHIVQVFDLIDEAEGTLALVMELLRGESLDRYLSRSGGRLGAKEAVSIVAPILAALAHAHRLGVVHRDVKPANIFLHVDAEGEIVPKLVDFGVAKAPAAGAALTIAGDALGTPRYMAPEQIRGSSDVDGRSDLFSVAVTLVELMSGASPFAAPTPAAALVAVLERELDPDPSVPPALWVEIGRSLAKRPFERHASASEFSDALRNALGVTREGLAETLRGLPSPEESDRPRTSSAAPEIVAESVAGVPKSKPSWRLAAAGALLVATVAFAFAWVKRADAPAARSAAASPKSAVVATAAAPPSQAFSVSPLPPAPPATGAAASAPPSAARKDPPEAPLRPHPVTTRKPKQDGPKPVATSPGF